MEGYLPITSLFAAAHIMAFTILSFAVGSHRMKFILGSQKGLDADLDVAFKRKASAQTNFYQYLPAILLGLGLLEGSKVFPSASIYGIGLVITLARLSHAAQLLFPQQIPLAFRIAGFVTTMVYLGATSVLLFLVGLQDTGLVPHQFFSTRTR